MTIPVDLSSFDPMKTFLGTALRSIPLLVVTGPVGAFVALFLVGSTWQWGAFGGWLFAMVLAAINGERSAGGQEPAASSDTEPGGLFYKDSSYLDDPYHDQTNMLSPLCPNNPINADD